MVEIETHRMRVKYILVFHQDDIRLCRSVFGSVPRIGYR